MDVTAGVLFDIGQQRREVVAGLFERIVQFGVADELADRAFALRDTRHEVVEVLHGLRKFAGELLLGELRGETIHVADDAVHAPSILAEHVGEFRKVVQRALQAVFLRREYLGHVARHGVQVAERPGDVVRIGFHQAVQVFERARKVGGELRNLLLEEIQLGAGHVHQIAVAARTQRIALLEVGVGRAVGDFDRLGTHQPVAEDLGLGIGRDAVLALDGELQHDLVAARGVERKPCHGADLHALHHDRRRVLHAVDLVVGGIILDVPAENVETFQKPNSGPGNADHRHGEYSDLNFPFHISLVFISQFAYPGSTRRRRRGKPCALRPAVSGRRHGYRTRRRNIYSGTAPRRYTVSPCCGRL